MKAGRGGDLPENDLEAILEAANKFPAAGDIILISDNWAAVKDISLLNKLNRPVHIIVCGARGYVHPDYTKIALQTGGSVHTLEQDFNLNGIKSAGKSFSIGNVTYQIKDGELAVLKYE
jgi:hypothetical protein